MSKSNKEMQSTHFYFSPFMLSANIYISRYIGIICMSAHIFKKKWYINILQAAFLCF